MLLDNYKKMYYKKDETSEPIEITAFMSVGGVIWNIALSFSDPNLWEFGGFAASGEELDTTKRIRTKSSTLIEGDTINLKIDSMKVVLRYEKQDGSFLSFSDYYDTNATITPPSGAIKFRLLLNSTPEKEKTTDDAITANISIDFL